MKISNLGSNSGRRPAANALNQTLIPVLKKNKGFGGDFEIQAQKFRHDANLQARGKHVDAKHTHFKRHLTLYYTLFFLITKQNNRFFVYSLLIFETDKQKKQYHLVALVMAIFVHFQSGHVFKNTTWLRCACFLVNFQRLKVN